MNVNVLLKNNDFDNPMNGIINLLKFLTNKTGSLAEKSFHYNSITCDNRK